MDTHEVNDNVDNFAINTSTSSMDRARSRRPEKCAFFNSDFDIVGPAIKAARAGDISPELFTSFLRKALREALILLTVFCDDDQADENAAADCLKQGVDRLLHCPEAAGISTQRRCEIVLSCTGAVLFGIADGCSNPELFDF